MSASLHLAGPDDAKVLLPMIAAYHAEEGLETTPDHRKRAIGPLLAGSPLGCVYLIGPRNAPIGYIVITFGWSLEFGGMDGFVDEFFVRPGVRGRGVGTEVLQGLLLNLEEAGLHALHLETAAERPGLQRLYARAGFKIREGYRLMTRTSRRRS